MLRQFSNPEEVKKKARYYNLNQVYESTRRNKKYMVHDGNKFIHFGAMEFEDFTKHHDKTRLNAFRAEIGLGNMLLYILLDGLVGTYFGD